MLQTSRNPKVLGFLTNSGIDAGRPLVNMAFSGNSTVEVVSLPLFTSNLIPRDNYRPDNCGNQQTAFSSENRYTYHNYLRWQGQ